MQDQVARELAEMARLLAHRNLVDEEIARILARPAHPGHLGEWIAARVFDIELEVPATPFPRVPLAEAKRIVAERGYEVPRTDGDLDPEGERQISAHVEETYGHQFVFITDYHPEIRAFYHMRNEETGLTKSYDLLFKGVEITTGAQREHRVDVLIEQAREVGLDGVVITDHDHQWDPEEVAELAARAQGLKVFSGAEVSAREGHFLVYGLPDLDEAPAGVLLADLLRVVKRHGAAIVAANVFIGLSMSLPCSA